MTASAVVQGIAIGLLIAVLFSAVPLLDVRRVKPSLLLRDSVRAGGRDWVGWGALAALLAALAGIASWQAGSIRIGLAVSVGLAAVTAVLTLVGVGFVRAVRPLAASRVVALRHAVLRLTRPGNQTRAVLLSVGLGAFFIVGVRSLQANLLDQFSVTLGGDAADMFLIDVQPAQAEGVARLLEASTGTPAAASHPGAPRASHRGLGEGAGRPAGEDGAHREGLRREFTVTWRDRLQPNERVVEGQFWGAGRADSPEVSIEQSLRDRSGIRLGDLVTFDVLGREISARVTSVRAVDWRDARQGGFMFVFRPGPLDEAPGTFVAPVRGPSDPAARARLQRGVVDRFPNVSVIDLKEILQIVERVIAERHARREHRRRPGAVRGRPDPRRVRLDDQVPANLRGGDLPHARRGDPFADADDGARVRRARLDGRRDRLDCRHRADVRREPARARHSVVAAPVDQPGRDGGDRRRGLCGRPRGQRGYSPSEAARVAAIRIEPAAGGRSSA